MGERARGIKDEKKRGVQITPSCLGLSNSRMELPLAELEKDCGWGRTV